VTDADSFEAFVREYQDMVFATAVRLLGNPVDAEDVAQTVFLKAYERFAQVGTSPNVAGWLKTVATNICLNHLSRYRSRWRLFSEMRRETDDGGEAEFETTVAAANAPPGAEMDARERTARIEGAVRALPEHQRVPLVLFHFEQQSYQEIADRLGISLAKVKTDIHRGRDALRGKLGTL